MYYNILENTCDCGGDSVVDDCGVCGGDGSSCSDDGGDDGGIVTDGCDLPDNNLYLSGGDVLYNSTDDIAGFQFEVDGAAVLGAAGGDAAAAGFVVQSGGSTVLGFSFSAAVVPAGCGTLTSLDLDGNATGLINIIMSNASGAGLDFSYYEGGGDDGSCDDEDNDGICDDVDDCVGEYDECDVCNGDGIADGACDCEGNVEDCAGDCGGDSVVDDCGVCGGDGSSCTVPDTPGGNEEPVEPGNPTEEPEPTDAPESAANLPDCAVPFCLYLMDYKPEESTVSAYYRTSATFKGFQFKISGGTISGLRGGDAAEVEWMLNNSEAMALGFSMTDKALGPGEGVLTVLELKTHSPGMCPTEMVIGAAEGTEIVSKAFCL